MAKSSSVGHSDPDMRKRKGGSIGALMTMGQGAPAGQIRPNGSGGFEQNIELQGGGFGFRPRNLDPGEQASIGAIAQPTASEAPPKDNAEFQSRVQRNFEWANSPEVQAALMQFAMGMTAPVNSPADFMGNITRAVGGGFQAASRVHDANLEEQAFLSEEDRKDRRLAVEEGNLGVSEKRLAIDQAELNQKLKKGTTTNIVVSSENPINKKFNLGIPPGSSAKVAVTVDDSGAVTGASVEAGFDTGAGGDKSSGVEQLQKDRAEALARHDTNAVAELDKKIKLETTREGEGEDKSSPLEQLQKDRAEALARGDAKAAAEIDLKIATESAGENIAADHMLVPDPDHPGEFKQVVIPGSKAALAQEEAQKADANKHAHGLIAAGIVGINVKKALEIIDRNPMPNLTVTGIAALAAELPLPSDTKSLRNAIDAVKSNVTIETLSAMREASPTGGALGSVSDYEDQMMQSSMGKLDQYGRAEDLADNLRRVNSTMHLIVDGNQIAKIGEQVQAEILTPEQGFAEVEALIDEDVAKAAAVKQAAATEKARELIRGGGDLQAGDNAAVPDRMLEKEIVTPDRPQTIEPPAERASLSPEEQHIIDVQNQIVKMIDDYHAQEGVKDDFVMPEGLNEADADVINDLGSDDEKRVYVQALRDAKKAKKTAKPMTSDLPAVPVVPPKNIVQPSAANPDITKATPDDFITLGDVMNFFRGK